MMTAEEYHDMVNQGEMYDYFRSQNAANFEQKGKEPFNILDMNFALGPLEKVFGPAVCGLPLRGRCRFLPVSRAIRPTTRLSRSNQGERLISISIRRYRPLSTLPLATR